MQYPHLFIYGGIFLIVVAFIFGYFRRKAFDDATQILFMLTAITLFEECLAYYCALRYHQNILVLRIYSLVEIVFISLYFNYSVHWFRARRTGIYIAAFFFLAGLADFLFRKTMYELSGPFMFLEGLAILSMALFALFQLVSSYDHLVITSIAHFWIAVILIIYWSFSILSLTFYNLFRYAAPQWINYMFFTVNYPIMLQSPLCFYFILK
jgi:hypothetical protein